jgi:bifunctional DNase/RNase
LDARTSDAVAMAVRFDAPIFTTSDVLNEAGILLELDETPKVGDEETESDEVSDFNDLSGISLEELNQLLADAVKEEDYDTALRLQEEIKRRNKKID